MTWLPLGSSSSMLCSSATMNVESPQPQISTSCSAVPNPYQPCTDAHHSQAHPDTTLCYGSCPAQHSRSWGIAYTSWREAYGFRISTIHRQRNVAGPGRRYLNLLQRGRVRRNRASSGVHEWGATRSERKEGRQGDPSSVA